MATANAQHVLPTIGSDGFNCPVCGAYAHQTWSKTGITDESNPTVARGRSPERKRDGDPFSGYANFADSAHYRGITDVLVSECGRCRALAIWLHDQLVWPTRGDVPPPSPDLPEDVQADYREAGAVALQSPRSAAALLRLAVEKLCRGLVPDGRDLNACIAALVQRGLDLEIQQALDYVRVVGNNAVHAGQMDLADDQETVSTLFALVNPIADTLITRKREMAELYRTLPDSAKSAIAERDQKDHPA